jgi:hypothetical protein
MSKNEVESRNNASDTEPKIGYKNPPKHTQFKKGQSGNPSGRPKKDFSIADYVKKISKRKVKISVGGKTRTVTYGEALLEKHFGLAANGNPKSTVITLNYLEGTETDRNDGLPKLIEQFEAIHQSHERRKQRRTKTSNKTGKVDSEQLISKKDTDKE